MACNNVCILGPYKYEAASGQGRVVCGVGLPLENYYHSLSPITSSMYICSKLCVYWQLDHKHVATFCDLLACPTSLKS